MITANSIMSHQLKPAAAPAPFTSVPFVVCSVVALVLVLPFVVSVLGVVVVVVSGVTAVAAPDEPLDELLGVVAGVLAAHSL